MKRRDSVPSSSSPQQKSEVMTLPEVAAFLKCHPSTVYRLLKAGDLPAFRLGKVIMAPARFLDRIDSKDTIDWIFDEQGKIGTESVGWYYWIKDHARPNLRRRLGATRALSDLDPACFPRDSLNKQIERARCF